MSPADKDVAQQSGPAIGDGPPVYPRKHGRHFFYSAFLLISASAVLIWLPLSGNSSTPLGLQVALAAAMLSVALLFTFRFLRSTTEVKHRLSGELTHSQDAGVEMASELQALGLDYRSLFMGNPIPMWIFSRRTARFMEVNDAAVEHYGYSRDEFLGMSIYAIREEAGSLLAYLPKVKREQQYAGIWPHRKKDGTAMDMQIASRELLWRGVASRFVCATDVTERLRVERETLETNLNLESMVLNRTGSLNLRKEELESINKELAAFSYSASHDLRTPLFVINTFTQILIKDYGKVLKQEGKDYLFKIEAGCLWMTSLIDSLLRLADVSQKMPKREVMDLSAVAEEVASAYRIKEPGRELELRIQPGLMIEADYRLLRIVMENLLSNAWKFTAKTPHPRIEIGMLANEPEAPVYVRDNGAGFDMGAAGKLFRTFERLHADSEFIGHGIGLSTVQRIIKRHGGRIWAEAEPGKGATFFFTLGGHTGNTTIPYKPAGRGKSARAE